MKIKHYLSLILLFVCLSFEWASAKEVVVKEVNLSLFNKPVVGYRMALDKSPKFLTAQVIKHASRFKAKPFQFENTIIFENVMYPAITESKEISLYFLLQPLPGNHTQLTVVGMYDYKRSINSKYFPELSIRMLYDLAYMLKNVSGDKLQFENMVLDGTELDKMAAENTPKPEDNVEPIVERSTEEETIKNDVRIKKDPFKEVPNPPAQNSNTLIENLNKKIAALEEKEKLYAQREQELKDQNEQINDLKDQIKELKSEKKVLSDSLDIAMDRLRVSMQLDMAGDEVSISTIDKKRIKDLEVETSTLKSQIETFSAKEDSLTRIALGYEKRVTQLTIENTSLEKDLREMRSENALLKADYLLLKTKTTTGTATVPAESGGQQANGQLQLENQQLKSQIKELSASLKAKESELETLKQQSLSAATSEDLWPRINNLRDSINILKQSLSSVNAGKADTEGLSALVDQQKMKLARKEIVIDSMKAQYMALQKDMDDVTKLNDDLETKLKVSLATLKEMKGSSEGMLEKVDDYQANLAGLQKDLETIRKQNKRNENLVMEMQDSIITLRGEKLQLKDNAVQASERVQKLEKEKEQLEAGLAKSKQTENGLKVQVASLESTIDSLKLADKPLTEQEKDLRALRNKLDEQEKALAAKEGSLNDKEKLLREKDAAVEERLAKAIALEQRYSDISMKEDRLKALEQKISQMGIDNVKSEMGSGSSPQPVLTKPVSGSLYLLNGEYVPVFTLETDLSYRKSERQVAGFMVKKGVLFDEKYPDLVYQDILLKDISGERLTVRIALEVNGTGTIVRASFKDKSGNYISKDDHPAEAEKIRTFLEKMFAFRF